MYANKFYKLGRDTPGTIHFGVFAAESCHGLPANMSTLDIERGGVSGGRGGRPANRPQVLAIVDIGTTAWSTNYSMQYKESDFLGFLFLFSLGFYIYKG